MQAQRLNSKPWEGMSLNRLVELKSLSDAPEFTIYLVNKKNVRKFVNRLQNELPKTLAPIHINLKTVYEGRGAAWDAWELYNNTLASLPRISQNTDDSTTIIAPPCRPLTPHQAAPPTYSKTDPNAACISRGPSSPPTVKRPCDIQEEDAPHKKIRDDRASQWEWHNADYPLGSPTEENTPSSRCEHPSRHSTVESQSPYKGQSRQGGEVTEGARSSPNISADDGSTQGHTPSPDLQLTPAHPHTPDHPCTPARNSFHDLRSIRTPPYAPSFASTVSLNRITIKPTIFTTRPEAHAPSTITLTLSELESLITTSIRAQIPLIAAHVQTHNLTTEMTAWAQPSIADYIATHMPAVMHEAVSAHVSDVNDEFESASAALHEVKEDAVTEIRAAEESGIQEVHRESRIAVDNLQEHSQRLSDALEDKCTELEDRLETKSNPLAPPEYSKQPPSGASSAKEAVKVFERFHRGRLTPDEQVRVLLSIAKFSNAEVFMAADLESRRMLVAHWSGRKD
jgi:hypothetical protein